MMFKNSNADQNFWVLRLLWRKAYSNVFTRCGSHDKSSNFKMVADLLEVYVSANGFSKFIFT